MARKFGSHQPRPNEYVTGAEEHPTEGHPDGVPEFPPPLPGSHRYPVKPETKPETLAVPPPEPYYSAGMAHGVRETSHPDQNERLLSFIQGELRSVFREMFRGEPLHPDSGEGEPKIPPIPVVITEPGAGVHPLAKTAFRNITVRVGDYPVPVPIVDRNRDRTRVLILNETATGGIRLLNGPVNETGSLLPANTNRYSTFHTQDQIWAVTDSTATVDQVLSIIEEYKVSG